MRSNVDQPDRQFLERLHRLGSSTIHEIGEAIGVTATAVRQRLTRLQESSTFRANSKRQDVAGPIISIR